MDLSESVFNNLVVSVNDSIIHVLKKMDASHHKMLLVFSDEKFYSIITIGDIQRSIIGNVKLSSCVSSIIDRDSKCFASISDSVEKIKKMVLAIRAEFMPVLDEQGNLVKLYSWNDFFHDSYESIKRPTIDIPVVIMAGGRGTRLEPLTNIIPKPLVPIGHKTILETIMDQFESIGCNNFYISVNYKDDMIKYYMSTLEHKYNVEFFKEDKPLGTIGSISLLKKKNFTTPFFVSNCDILIDQDYRDVYRYHLDNKNDITLITSVKSIDIPYGVIETGSEGIMLGLTEKPEITYMVNTGVYILQPELIQEVPDDSFFHITQLIDKIKLSGGRVGCFPVSENSLRDIGTIKDYFNMISNGAEN